MCLRCRGAKIWSNVGGIEAKEVVTGVGNIICRYQAGKADNNACGEELHGDVDIGGFFLWIEYVIFEMNGIVL